MQILITGATGFLGSRLVEYLIEQEPAMTIIATGRKFSSDNRVKNERVNYVLGDLSKKEFVETLFNNQIDCVINCASLSSPWGTVESFYQANIKTQNLLLDESIKHNIKRFIYISSPSIYFNFKDALNITEERELPTTLVNEYARTKRKAEILLKESKLNYVILRPRALIGRGDTVIMPRLIRSHREGRLKIMGSGNNRVDLTSVVNMAEAIRLSIHTANINEDYNISNGEPVKLWESINQVLTAIGLSTITQKLPYRLLMCIAGIMEIRASFSKNKSEPVLTKYGVGVLARSFTFDITKARNKLGYKPSQSTKDAIQEFAQWYKLTNND